MASSPRDTARCLRDRWGAAGRGRSLARGETRIAEARVAHRVWLHTSNPSCGWGSPTSDSPTLWWISPARWRDVIADHPGDVYVPAYQRGHPDHDAVFVAAQLARAALVGARTTARDDRRDWYVYTLYGLDHDGRERFDWLDPAVFDDVRTAYDTPDELTTKAAALRAFASQLPDESVLAGWLARPVPEHSARLPDLAAPLPRLRCFYEEIFEFSQFGIDPERVTALLEAALLASSG